MPRGSLANTSSSADDDLMKFYGPWRWYRRAVCMDMEFKQTVCHQGSASWETRYHTLVSNQRWWRAIGQSASNNKSRRFSNLADDVSGMGWIIAERNLRVLPPSSVSLVKFMARVVLWNWNNLLHCSLATSFTSIIILSCWLQISALGRLQIEIVT